MSDGTAISWSDATWNPVRGCARVSPGCENCYAERVAARFSGPGQPYEGLAVMGQNGPRWTREVAFIASRLEQPLRWKKPRRIFVNSMSDLFQDGFTNGQIAAVFGVMAACPQHTFQLLTKRARRMRDWFDWLGTAHPERGLSFCVKQAAERIGDIPRITEETRQRVAREEWPLPNVWLGVSAEDQQRADERVPYLLDTPAAVRFVSYEPALGPVNLRKVRPSPFPIDSLTGSWAVPSNADGHYAQEARIRWVICGAESGPGKRPMDLDWARSVRDQCAAAGVAFFFKQQIDGDSGKKVELPFLDGVQHKEFPR